jgi:hypothetical protein
MNNVASAKLMERISEALFEKNLDDCSLTEIEKTFSTIAKHHGCALDFFELLFQLDDSNCSPLEHIVSENAINLFIDLLDKYEDKFLLIKPEKWEFLLFYPSHDCHEHFINIFGNDYFENVASGTNFTRYHIEHFKKLYINGKLDDYFKVENMKSMYDSPSCSTIHALSFYDSNKEKFKQFMQEQFTSELSADLSNCSSNWLQYNRLICRLNVNIKGLEKTFILKLPSNEELEILIEKWGIDKTSQVISDYMNYQKEYLTQPSIKNKYKIKFDEERLVNLITKKIKFINCSKALSFGLKTNLELLSYLIINGSIKQEDLLTNINNKQLYTEAHCVILDSSLDKQDDDSIKRKLKL